MLGVLLCVLLVTIRVASLLLPLAETIKVTLVLLLLLLLGTSAVRLLVLLLVCVLLVVSLIPIATLSTEVIIP